MAEDQRPSKEGVRESLEWLEGIAEKTAEDGEDSLSVLRELRDSASRSGSGGDHADDEEACGSGE